MKTFLAVLLVTSVIAQLPGQEAPSSGKNLKPAGFQGPGGRPQSEEQKEKTRLRLGITKEQQTQIEALHIENMKQHRELFSKMRDLMGQLRAYYDSYEFDQEAAKSIRKQIMSLHFHFLKLQAEFEEKLRKILTKEQFERMRAVMKEEWEKGRRRFGGPPGGPPSGTPRPPQN